MVVNSADFQPKEFFKNCPIVKNRRGNPSGKKRHYIGITTAFDIETTVINEIEQAIMYIWQWQIGESYTIIGRTWEEFTDLQQRIKEALPQGYWLVVYVHNLSHEIQYLKGIYPFTPSEIFAVASRQVIKCDMYGVYEFRCSYKLTNMSLDQFTKKMKVKHSKLSGVEFDYTKKRYPWTKLTKKEMQYCINDVQGLVEAVNALMGRDKDTLQTIPLTSTGYVRRNAKRAMRNGLHHNFVFSILPDIELYYALHEAFRGGNNHASRYMAGDIIKDVHSADRSSSYPAVMCNCEFPMSVFIPVAPSDLNLEYISRCITIRHKAVLLRIGIKNLKLRDPYWGCPYLSIDKCRNIHKAKNTEDNGRILSADYLETTITDVDLKIILEEYDGELVIFQAWYSSYKKLPAALINEVIKYYKDKTELKGVSGQELYYDKAKALLNALYGMMAQNPVKHSIIFQQVGDWLEDDTPDENILEENNKRAFLAYQWGVWVTAWARYELERGIKLVHDSEGACFVYCDTDSVKYIGDVDWTDYNNDKVRECLSSGAYAIDPAGITHYMGVFETEDDPDTGVAYKYFKTLGAKKYAYVVHEGEGTHCTIAGVNKKLGGAELDEHGGLAAFEPDFVFRKAGGTQAVYNDDPEVKTINIDGHELKITSNVAILPSEYTLGITGEYKRIIEYAKNYLYNPYVI